MKRRILDYITGLSGAARLFILLILLVSFEAGFFAFAQISAIEEARTRNNEALYQHHADQIVEKCSTSNYRPACYDKEIPELMSVLSMEEAFEVTKLVQENDQEYWYCHVLGHNLSAQETAKDPENWKEVIGRCPSSICSNGCIHGAFQERFRVEALPDAEIEELKPELEGICEARRDWSPTGLERATCSHALGHLTMYITDANIEKSTSLCTEIASNVDGRDHSQLCYDGAFMQIFQPLEPEDFALVEGKQTSKEEHPSFCGQFTGAERSSCWTEGWPLYFEEIKTPEGLVEFCSFLEDDSRHYSRCYEGLIYVLTALFGFEEEPIISLCSGLPEQQRGQCFANAASRMIETDARLIDRSVRMCSVAEEFGVADRCYEELLFYSTYNFHFGSEEFLYLCSQLPEAWKKKCLAGDRVSR